MGINVAIIDGMSSCTAGDLSNNTNNLISQAGVILTDGTDLEATQSDTPALSVKVKVGSCYVLNDNYVKNTGDVKFWHINLDLAVDVSIDTNTSGDTRIDAICVKVDTAVTPDATGSNVASIVAVKGTPALGNPTIPDEHLLLDYITVADGETQILDADISDERTYFRAHILDVIDGIKQQSIINGGFTINQRGYVSSATLASGIFGHDRWKAGSGGGNYSFTQLDSSTQITIASGKSLIQVIEDVNVYGGDYTLSWSGTAQARAGVNSSTPSGSYSSSPLSISSQTAGTVMSIEFNEGTLGEVQLNTGDIALSFNPKTRTDELQLCQRYCQDLTGGNTVANMIIGGVHSEFSATARGLISLPTTMRDEPSIDTNYLTVANWSLGYPGSFAITAITASIINSGSAIFVTISTSGLVVDRHYHLYRPGTTDKFIIEAEL